MCGIQHRSALGGAGLDWGKVWRWLFIYVIYVCPQDQRCKCSVWPLHKWVCWSEVSVSQGGRKQPTCSMKKAPVQLLPLLYVSIPCSPD